MKWTNTVSLLSDGGDAGLSAVLYAVVVVEGGGGGVVVVVGGGVCEKNTNDCN